MSLSRGPIDLMLAGILSLLLAALALGQSVA